MVLLASCAEIFGPPPPDYPEGKRPFLTLVTLDEYEKNPSRGWGWANSPALPSVKVGTELVLIFGAPPGAHRAELKGRRWDEYLYEWVGVPGLHFVVERDEVGGGGVWSFGWTPREKKHELDWYWFTLYLLDSRNNPIFGTPVNLMVLVK